MSNRQYFKAEALKHRHTVLRKLLILMPVICVALAAFLTHVFFAVDGYNWWYMGMYPGFVALVCGTICEKEKKMKSYKPYCNIPEIYSSSLTLAKKKSSKSALMTQQMRQTEEKMRIA